MANADGQIAEALTLLRTALAIFQVAGDDREAAITKGSLIAPLITAGRLDEASELSRQAMEVLSKHGSDRYLASLHLTTGTIAWRRDEWLPALNSFLAALRIFMVEGGLLDRALCFSNAGACYVHIGQIPRGLRLLARAAKIAEDERAERLLQRVRYNEAWALMTLGATAEAFRSLGRVSLEMEKLGDDFHVALCHLAKGQILLSLNILRDSRVHLVKSLVEFEELGSGFEAAKSRFFLGVLSSYERNQSESLRLMTMARSTFAETRNLAWVRRVDLQRADIHLRFGDLASASTEIAKVSRDITVDQAETDETSALALLLRARVQVRESKFEDAIALAKQLLGAIALLDRDSLMLEAFATIGEAHLGLGEVERSQEAFRRAEELADQLSADLPPLELRVGFLAGKRGLFQSMFVTALAQKDLANAFLACQKAGATELTIPLDSDSTNRAADRTLSGSLAELKARLVRLELELDETGTYREQFDIDRALELRRARSALESRIQDVLRQLSLHAYGASDSKRYWASLKNLQETVGKDEVVLNYIVLDRTIACLSITDSGVGVHELASHQTVQRARDLLSLSLNRGAAQSATALQQTNRHLEVLYRLLLEPIEEQLRARTIVVPDGVIQEIPFHALRDEGGYLMRRVAFSFTPNATEHIRKGSLPVGVPRSSLIAGVSDQRAPQMREEARRLSQLLPNASLLLDEQATLGSLHASLQEAELVHIASHGVFRTERPLFSSLRLSNGPFYLHDIVNTNLSASKLVVLSGCRTARAGRSPHQRSLDWPSMLLSAGAGAVVASQWKVDDATGFKIMLSFYEKLLRGQPKDTSLQDAMRECSTDREHPYFWGPFVLWGNRQGLGVAKKA